METPLHGIRPKKNRNLPKMNFFEAFPVFSKIIGNPSNTIFRGISRFFDPFPLFLGRIPVYQGLVSLRDFPIFLIRFLIFWVRFWFSKKVSNSQFVDRFHHFLGLFPLFWDCFLFLGLLPLFGTVSSFLGLFPLFWDCFLIFG